MNREKKEEIKRYQAARAGLSPDEVAAVDRRESHQKAIKDLARTLHAEQFPEETDFCYDSSSDAKDRSRDINPMSDDYVKRVDERRIRMGFAPLLPSGLPQSQETMEYCIELAKKQLGESN